MLQLPASTATAAPRTNPVLAELMSAYSRHQRVRTVAVIGNAPLRPNPRRAAAIDACDLVVRVNGFALDDASGPASTGTRADVVVLQWVVKATPWLFLDYSRRLYLLNEPGRLHWDIEVVPPWWPADLGLVPVPNREVTLPLVEELGLSGSERPRWATTGTTAVVLTRHTFPDARLLVAGFSFLDDPDQRSWAHAYGQPCRVNDEHDLRAEATLMRRMATDGGLEVLR